MDVVFSFSLPCCLPVLLLLLLLCLVMWLSVGALPSRASVFPSQAFGREGGAELKQLGPGSWGPLWDLL